MPEPDSPEGIPSAEQLARAIEIYLAAAYEGQLPSRTRDLLPPQGSSPLGYLMSDRVERTPPGATFDEVRSFAMRLGNKYYPNMKLRLSRPPNQRQAVLSVDSHDAFLNAPPGSPDSQALAELKRQNATIAAAIGEAWDAAGLPTEKNFLRDHIDRARLRNKAGGGPQQ